MVKLGSLFAAGLLSTLAGCAAHQDSNMPKELQSLGTLDCSKDREQCHYIAAFEVAAYFDACPTAIARKFNSPDADGAELVLIDGWLANWKDLDTPQLKAAVLDKNNPLRLYLKDQTLDYLASIPVDDVGLECSRLGMVKEGQTAVSMSDLLRHTKDFGKAEKTLIH
jgi:hypothetical protein